MLDPAVPAHLEYRSTLADGDVEVISRALDGCSGSRYNFCQTDQNFFFTIASRADVEPGNQARSSALNQS